MDQPTVIAVRLRRLREAFEFDSAREFALFLGINEQAWNHFERGRRSPGIHDAIRIAQKTGASLDWIFRGLESTLPLHVAQRLARVPEDWELTDRRRKAN